MLQRVCSSTSMRSAAYACGIILCYPVAHLTGSMLQLWIMKGPGYISEIGSGEMLNL